MRLPCLSHVYHLLYTLFYISFIYFFPQAYLLCFLIFKNLFYAIFVAFNIAFVPLSWEARILPLNHEGLYTYNTFFPHLSLYQALPVSISCFFCLSLLIFSLKSSMYLKLFLKNHMFLNFWNWKKYHRFDFFLMLMLFSFVYIYLRWVLVGHRAGEWSKNIFILAYLNRRSWHLIF